MLVTDGVPPPTPPTAAIAANCVELPVPVHGRPHRRPRRRRAHAALGLRGRSHQHRSVPDAHVRRGDLGGHARLHRRGRGRRASHPVRDRHRSPAHQHRRVPGRGHHQHQRPEPVRAGPRDRGDRRPAGAGRHPQPAGHRDHAVGVDARRARAERLDDAVVGLHPRRARGWRRGPGHGGTRRLLQGRPEPAGLLRGPGAVRGRRCRGDRHHRDHRTPTAAVATDGSAVVGYWSDKADGSVGLVVGGSPAGNQFGRRVQITSVSGDAGADTGTWPGRPRRRRAARPRP